MNAIRDTSTVPDTGWMYPGLNGYVVETRNYALLYDLVKQHYEANGVPVPSQQDVIDWMCENLFIPCYDKDSRKPLVNRFTSGLPVPKSRGCSSCK